MTGQSSHLGFQGGYGNVGNMGRREMIGGKRRIKELRGMSSSDESQYDYV